MSETIKNIIDEDSSVEEVVATPVKDDLEVVQQLAETCLQVEAAAEPSTEEQWDGILPTQGRDLSSIRASLSGLIARSEAELEDEAALSCSRGVLRSPAQDACLVAHALAAHVASLDAGLKVARTAASHVARWLGPLFGFEGGECSASFSRTPEEGLVRVARRLPPCTIYVCPPVEGLPAYLARQLGLSCIVSAPFESNTKDPQCLTGLCEHVEKQGSLPALVACLGTPHPSLAPFCKQHGMWLHLGGHALAMPSARRGDSVTLRLGEWSGLPSLPCITLHRGQQEEEEAVVLEAVPAWVTLQAMGSKALQGAMEHAVQLTNDLLQCIQQFPEIRTLPLFEEPAIVYQYVQTPLKNEQYYDKNPPYFDNLNSWLVQLMCRLVPRVRTELVDSAAHGICLRVCPLEHANALGTTQGDVEQYSIHLQQQIGILAATVRQKGALQEELSRFPRLRAADLPHWAGIGGVRYVPEPWADELTDAGKSDINRLNAALVARLKDEDSAFSLGECSGLSCVRLGMVDAGTGLAGLLEAVQAAGDALHEDARFLETMSEMIKQGIQEANKELVQENQEKIYKEGVLRQVPVIGSLVSWWSPTPAGIKGRSFHLASGTIESTENIYKYHMQVKDSSSSPPPPE